jgi:hypothetical protein
VKKWRRRYLSHCPGMDNGVQWRTFSTVIRISDHGVAGSRPLPGAFLIPPVLPVVADYGGFQNCFARTRAQATRWIPIFPYSSRSPFSVPSHT